MRFEFASCGGVGVAEDDEALQPDVVRLVVFVDDGLGDEMPVEVPGDVARPGRGERGGLPFEPVEFGPVRVGGVTSVASMAPVAGS